MKKLFAVMLVICLLLGSAALAETIPEVNWEDYFAAAVAGIPGDFVTFDEIAVKIWLPAQLQAVELTEEDRAEGYIGYYTEDTDNATVAIVYVDTDGKTIEEYASLLEQTEGVTENPGRGIIICLTGS